jgi:hypothetical protein
MELVEALEGWEMERWEVEGWEEKRQNAEGLLAA